LIAIYFLGALAAVAALLSVWMVVAMMVWAMVRAREITVTRSSSARL
jgi:hypothetical protein